VCPMKVTSGVVLPGNGLEGVWSCHGFYSRETSHDMKQMVTQALRRHRRSTSAGRLYVPVIWWRKFASTCRDPPKLSEASGSSRKVKC